MRVGLVGCVKAKADCARAAEDLYTSALFKGRRAYVEHGCDRWFILSARHGLVGPATVLEPYEESLGDAAREARRAWSARVLRQLAGQLGALGAHSFEIHAGAAYRDFGLVSGLQAMGASVEVPGEGLPIGKLLAFYGNAKGGISADRPARAHAATTATSNTRPAPLTEFLATASSPTTLTFQPGRAPDRTPPAAIGSQPPCVVGE